MTEEQETYQTIEPALEKEHAGDWIVISGREIAGVWPTSQKAVEAAVTQFGDSHFLIRQIGAQGPRLPRAA
jgi:hypothetical protein